MLIYDFPLRRLFHGSDDEEFEGFARNSHGLDTDEYVDFKAV
jgi:hypothetical protein